MTRRSKMFWFFSLWPVGLGAAYRYYLHAPRSHAPLAQPALLR